MASSTDILIDPMASGLAPNTSRHGRITAVSMMKDEGPYAIEWVAHHMAVGFTDFVVYTNDCTDGTDAMLRRMQDMGLVQHRENRIAKGAKPQPSAIRHAQEEPAVRDSDWVMVFDADEFLCLRHGDGKLDGLIDAVKDQGATGLVVTWRIFGSGGIQHWSRATVSEQYLMAAPPMWNKGWGVKTLFQFDPDKWKLGIHRPKFRNKVLDTDFPNSVKWLNGSGRPMEDYFKYRGWRSIVRTVGYDWAQMNHYAVKSIDAYAIRRFRGNVNNKADKYNDAYWALQDRNEVRDETMLRYKASRDRIMAALLADPELGRLHRAAVAQAEAALAAFKDTDDYAAFVASLKEASAIPISQVSATPPKQRDAAKIAASMSAIEARTVGARKTELARPRAERDLLPTDLYVGGAVDLSEDPALAWFENHGIRLPADPRIFTPAALLQIEAGKFQRNLARNLPGLLRNGRNYLELGAACGFLAARVRRAMPDVSVTLVEEGDWRAAAERVLAENAVDGVTWERCTYLPDLLRSARPDLLVLGGPTISLADVRDVIENLDHRPHTVVFCGRALVAEAGALRPGSHAFDALGYQRLPLDPTVAVGFCDGGQVPATDAPTRR
ncbi:MAG: glycosyltransferase family 2 protein [Pseudomonadota bacterium]